MAAFAIVPVTGSDEDGAPTVDWSRALIMRHELAGATQEDLLQRGVSEPGTYIVARLDNVAIRTVRHAWAVE